QNPALRQEAGESLRRQSSAGTARLLPAQQTPRAPVQRETDELYYASLLLSCLPAESLEQLPQPEVNLPTGRRTPHAGQGVYLGAVESVREIEPEWSQWRYQRRSHTRAAEESRWIELSWSA